MSGCLLFVIATINLHVSYYNQLDGADSKCASSLCINCLKLKNAIEDQRVYVPLQMYIDNIKACKCVTKPWISDSMTTKNQIRFDSFSVVVVFLFFFRKCDKLLFA